MLFGPDSAWPIGDGCAGSVQNFHPSVSIKSGRNGSRGKTDQSGKNLGWSGGRRTSATAAAASCQQQAGRGRTRQSTKPLVGLHELPPWAQSAAGTTPPEKRTRTADIVLTA